MSELGTQVQPPQQEKQSSEITGARAVVFVAIMFAVDFIGAAIASNPEVTGGIFKASFYLAAAHMGDKQDASGRLAQPEANSPASSCPIWRRGWIRSSRVQALSPTTLFYGGRNIVIVQDS